ncbi:MAG: hypothetical protein CMH26_04190 [Micavibrio sp.]|nr:hypothetical protein [Micavibrio sp.]
MPPAIEKEHLSAKMLLQVHDELIFEVPTDELEQTTTLVKNIMENAFQNVCGVKISVPLEVEAGHAHSWAQAH